MLLHFLSVSTSLNSDIGPAVDRVDRLELLVVAPVDVCGSNGVIVPLTFVLAVEGHARRAASHRRCALR